MTAGRRPRRRPRWWPEDEPWPPTGPPSWVRDGTAPPWVGPGHWRARRRGRGLGCLVGLAFLSMVFGVIVLLWLAGSLLGFVGASWGAPPYVHVFRGGGFLVLLLGILVLFAVGRFIVETLGTLDELGSAAERVERGDYATRVDRPRRGPGGLYDLVGRFNTMVGRLEADEEQRRSLLADVSHEMRTPLAVVRGNLEAIVDGVHPADESHLRAILDETAVLSRLVEDLRTLALSEAGTLALHPEPTDVAILAADVASGFAAAAERGGLTLRVDLPSDLPLLDVDPVRTREVLENLVANAVRHTPSGGTIAISGAAEPGGRTIRFAVVDDGSGVDPTVLPHLFDRYAKSPTSTGSGLGLAIARQLVEAQRGMIGATSEAGRGTTIWFSLPVGGG